MSQSILKIPREEYDLRIASVQKSMREKGIDLLVTHACGCESATVRYLTDFWAVFDFVGVLVPAEGKPILLTGGPESFDFAVQFARIDDVRVHPLYVETSAPEWDKPVNPWNFRMILDELRARMPIKTIGIANVNTLPHVVYADIEAGADGAAIVPAEDIIMDLRAVKSKNEIRLIREACRITEEAVRSAVDAARPGMREWELEALWRGKIYEMGAEGTGYPVWVTSGPSTYQSLCKSTDRPLAMDSMVQLSLGAKYSGYCGNIGRALILGKLPDRHMDMIRIAHDCMEETIGIMGPGVPFARVYDAFQARLEKHGLSGTSLYGPAHSTGLQECEDPWVDNRTGRILAPDMVFNIDIWIADHTYGVRIEDCVLVTESGLEQLTTWRREPIVIA